MESRQYSNCWYKDICENDCSRCTKYITIKSLMELSGVPEKLHHPISLNCPDEDYESFVRLQEIKEDIYDFVYSGKQLYICSEHTGNGKTSWSLKIMYKFFSEIWDTWGPINPAALFIYVPEFIMKLKDFNNPISQKYLEQVKTVPLVIWDDIGTSELSNFDYSQIVVYINLRQQAELSNIYTSNLINLEQLSDKVGDKLASRIIKGSEVIELKGTDKR